MSDPNPVSTDVIGDDLAKRQQDRLLMLKDTISEYPGMTTEELRGMTRFDTLLSIRSLMPMFDVRVDPSYVATYRWYPIDRTDTHKVSDE